MTDEPCTGELPDDALAVVLTMKLTPECIGWRAWIQPIEVIDFYKFPQPKGTHESL